MRVCDFPYVYRYSLSFSSSSVHYSFHVCFNSLRTTSVCIIEGLSPYRAVNTLHFSYKNQSVNNIQGYYKRNRHFQRYVVSTDLTPCDFFLWGVYQRQSFRSSTSGKFKRTETKHHTRCCKCWRGYAQVCLDRIRLSYWYLSCDKRLTHRTFVT